MQLLQFSPQILSKPLPQTVSIHDLRDHPDCLDQLAVCHQQQWQGLHTAISIEQRIQRLRAHLNPQALLPTTWLALADNQLLGSVSLVDYRGRQRGESDSIPLSNSPWLANLYVEPSLRQRGLGSLLVQHACSAAAAAGYAELYLFTPEHKTFYQRRNWRACYQARVQGQWVDVMKIPLHDCVNTPRRP